MGIKVSKAIEILRLITAGYSCKDHPDIVDSMKLGLEALKRELHYRTLNQPCFTKLLPGETPEEEVRE